MSAQLSRLAEQRALSARNTALLVCPPLLAAEVRRRNRVASGFGGQFMRRREFPSPSGWLPDDYERRQGAPAALRLEQLSSSSDAKVVAGATFADFRRQASDFRCHFIVLIAHHLQEVRPRFLSVGDRLDGLEFND
ncbi:MAG: hypothetical protein AAF517_16320, partial [Planctomycetota bacterium]